MMEKMSSAQLRSAFLQYFVERNHELVASGSLVPGDDPTLLFTNAGMVQFKDTFLGRETRRYKRAVSTQRCVRAGGKHNDLENVGYTARHHTFFEMLGNFSFGDYFKSEAIHFAWEFLTLRLQIPTDKLWVTVFEDDDDAARIWLNDIKIDPTRFSRLAAASNFWSMGDIGPCGPCTEIFYDHGDQIHGGPPGTANEDGDRYVELWNLVFMQFDRRKDGELVPLPKPSVDTGMGLERLAAVMQGVHNNYDIDLFKNLVGAIAQLSACSDMQNNSLRVIADHIRSCAFLIADGVLPSNEGRGYVLRRIIRRAIRHGYRLGLRDAFFFKLVGPLAQEMGEAFPELVKQQLQVERVLRNEEQRFAETLEHGMKILENCVSGLTENIIPGDVVFQLYDTYGFPTDLTADFAREHELVLDMPGFESAMQGQRERARAANRFACEYEQNIDLDFNTQFTGYQELITDACIVGLILEGKAVDRLGPNDYGSVILDKTPFYAESGGQVGDIGEISTVDSRFEVIDTQKHAGQVYLHNGVVKAGCLSVGDRSSAQVDSVTRKATALNHSATHLLHAALRQILGDHVTQKGSLVDAKRLRFDFSHFEPVSTMEMDEIEKIVNGQIRNNAAVQAEVMSKDDAMNAGAMALFGEKYGAEVRVLKIGGFSTELCGGTHVSRAGDIGYFKVLAETGVAAGIRRIEAVTGSAAVVRGEQNEKLLQRIARTIKGTRDNLDEKIEQLIEHNRQLEKELERMKAKIAASAGGELSSKAVEIAGLKVLAAKLEDVDAKSMRETVDQLKSKLGSAAIVLATVNDGKVVLIAGVTKDQTDKIKAGELVNVVAQQVGGKGGGRPDLAQAGGNNPAELDSALQGVADWVKRKMA